MLPEDQRVPEVAAWAKTKGLEALKTFESLLGDGRKYTAGDEFTVAGVHAVVAGLGCAAAGLPRRIAP